jgi:hypothetical protein
MNLIEIIENIVMIPSVFESEKDISVYDLLKKSGYFKAYKKVDALAIERILRQHKNYLDDWYNYSQNKRGGGWYIANDGNKALNNLSSGEKIQFSNEIEAVANFIKNEIEDMRQD